MDTSKVRYVIFDTFGTVVDWHSTVYEEGLRLSEKYGFEADWHEFANRWRDEGYLTPIFEIAHGKRQWEPVDSLHMRKLRALMLEYGFPSVSEEDIGHFNLVWHRLKPWPDAVEGLARLKHKYCVGPFTNGDFRLILDMAKNAGLPWDFITTADIFKKFKPNPEIYRDEIKLLGAVAEEVVMVAAHQFDLDGAKTAGCTTVFVPRPKEYGPVSNHIEPEGKLPYDIQASDFLELANILNA